MKKQSISLLFGLVGFVGLTWVHAKTPKPTTTTKPTKSKQANQHARYMKLFKEVVTYVAKRDIRAVTSRIADNARSTSYLLDKATTDRIVAKLAKRKNGKEYFFKRNFPGCRWLFSQLSTVTFLRMKVRPKDVEVKASRRAKSSSTGKVVQMYVKVPKAPSRLRKIAGVPNGDTFLLNFIKLGDKLFWVPFGW